MTTFEEFNFFVTQGYRDGTLKSKQPQSEKERGLEDKGVSGQQNDQARVCKKQKCQIAKEEEKEQKREELKQQDLQARTEESVCLPAFSVRYHAAILTDQVLDYVYSQEDC